MTSKTSAEEESREINCPAVRETGRDRIREGI